MVATWLVELLLDQINRALLEDTAEARAAVDDYTARLRAFLKVRCAPLALVLLPDMSRRHQTPGKSWEQWQRSAMRPVIIESLSTGPLNTNTNSVPV